ncbi:hypothetical protein EVAR_66166_1 [Eumeta japonica]|uniref:Uncharacterized protein n=1 Tax=Eumeta variegata TaxID=151549 RepID=A0A4C1ZQG3_EUMVA|nr:hypothetical protein EVAR_66166_1 [Eumeta japonica]
MAYWASATLHDPPLLAPTFQFYAIVSGFHFTRIIKLIHRFAVGQIRTRYQTRSRRSPSPLNHRRQVAPYRRRMKGSAERLQMPINKLLSCVDACVNRYSDDVRNVVSGYNYVTAGLYALTMLSIRIEVFSCGLELVGTAAERRHRCVTESRVDGLHMLSQVRST